MRYFFWESEDISSQLLETQTKDLIQFVKSKIRPYHVKEVEHMRRKIEEKAMELRETTPKEKQMKEFEVEVKEYVLEPK